jgi:hypothetical protein
MAKRLPKDVMEYFSKLGRKGGAMSAVYTLDEERGESARKAVQERWQRAKENSPGDR